jgi:integrase
MAYVERRGNIWLARWYEPGGKKASKAFKTKQEALDYGKLQEAWKVRNEYIDVELRRTPLYVYALDVIRSSQANEETRASNERRLKRWVAPKLGALPIGEITPGILRRYFADLPARTPTKYLIWKLLRMIFRTALKEGLIVRDPMEAIPSPKYRPAPVRVPSPEEVEAIAGIIKPESYRLILLVMYWGGLRISEATSLRWDDVDWATGRVTVGKSKTASGERAVTLPASVHEELVAYVRERGIGPGELLFRTPTGKQVNRQLFGHALKRACQKLGLPPIRPHALRHGDVSLMVELGVHPKIAQARAGHASSQLTLDVYAHVREGYDHHVAEAMDRVRKEATGKVVGLR